ncbi:MAG: hypothetical protein IJS13_04900 [Paludibacteraceae bacterium]|nr:hypothetical protein [Paludibacteraceae bacterium]
MAREIKFRAKSLDGIWEYGELHLRCNHPHIHNLIGAKIYIKPDTIGQYTGLHDKNGKEIYEGDIVKFVYSVPRLGKPSEERTDIGYVGFLQQEAGFVIVFKKREQRLGRRSACEFCVEVIGNIYDNPELLEGGNHGKG